MFKFGGNDKEGKMTEGITVLYLSIPKAKQFQRQPKKIKESDENSQEEDKEYLKK